MPILLEESHFVLGLVDVQNKKTYVFDSNGFERRVLAYRLYMLVHNLLGLVGTVEINEWAWVRGSLGPKQINRCDCGLYLCLTANYISIGLGMRELIRTNAGLYRERIALEILENKLS